MFRKDQNLIDTLAARTDRRGSPGHLRPQQVGAGPQGLAVHGAAGVHHRRAPHGLPGVDGPGAGRLRGPDARAARACENWAEAMGISPEEAVEGVSPDPRQLAAEPHPLRHRRPDLLPLPSPRTIRTSRPGCCRCGSSGPKACCSPPARTTTMPVACSPSGVPRRSRPSSRNGPRTPDTLDVDAATTMLWEFLTDEAKAPHESHAALAEGEAPGRRRVAGERREVGRGEEPGPGTLHDLPADWPLETRPEPSLHPPQLPRHDRHPSSRTRRTTTCG